MTITPLLATAAESPVRAFGLLNYTALAAYLLAVFGVGVWFTRQNKNTDDFFRGGQSVPWWAVGVSIFATMLSSITYMSMPAKAYAGDWTLVLQNLPIFLLAPVVIGLFLPVYRRLDATSAYEYLEKRFNYGLRLFGCVSFVVMQAGRVAVVLFLPALALSTVTDLNLYASIAMMGVFSVVYSMLGGFKAVIWTDVVQTVVLLSGALFSLLLILFNLDGGLSQLLSTGAANHKFDIAFWSWDVTSAGVAVVFIGGIFNQLVPLTSDQGYVQRYMSTRTEKQAAGAIWVNSIMTIPCTVLFLGLGTAMFVFYQQKGGLPSLPTPDAILPWFVTNELPAGMAGLVVAAIFAAAQSTMSASINSMSTVVTVDIVHRLRGKRSDAADLRLARLLTGLFGLAGMGAAYWIALANLQSMFDTFIKVVALTASPLAGVFILGIFTRRTTSAGMVVGILAGVAAAAAAWLKSDISFWLYAACGMLPTVIVGYLASFLTKRDSRDLSGLTFHTINRPQPNRGGLSR
ncbi:MAG: sodium:solute symporter [Opitutaceae bacterium]|jgi:SSS family transporter|nr:sodium:solute symporter [Opitutaceae bacterium]